jgi:hypothetical protein
MTMTTTDTPEAEALRVSIQREILKQDGPSPAIVSNVSTSGATVDAQPAISKTQRLEGVTTEIPRSEVRGAPVMMYGSTSKGIFVCPPISPGDDGVLIPMMRALDNWQHGQGVGPPPDMQTPRSGDLSDGAYYPGILRDSVEIANYPTDALTIQTADASTVFSLKAGEIKLTVGAMTVTLDAAGLHIVGPVDINGLLALTGNLGQMGNQIINGTVTANQFITAS